MNNKEYAFEKKIRAKLKSIPNSFWFTKTPSTAIRAVPDVLGTINGRFIALELKTNIKLAFVRTKTTEMQKYNINCLKSCGAFAEFLYPENEEEIFKKLIRISNVKD